MGLPPVGYMGRNTRPKIVLTESLAAVTERLVSKTPVFPLSLTQIKGGTCVKRKNNLSNNLKAFQKARHITQTEFAQALNMPKSTLQAVMLDGNTTLETLIHLADALDVSLDELVFSTDVPKKEGVLRWLLAGLSWYASQSPERQELLLGHIKGILELLTRDEVLHTVNDARRECDGDT